MTHPTEAQEEQSSSRSFTITQYDLGLPLHFEPAVGSKELDDLIDNYVPGLATSQQKRAQVALEFFNSIDAACCVHPVSLCYDVTRNIIPGSISAPSLATPVPTASTISFLSSPATSSSTSGPPKSLKRARIAVDVSSPPSAKRLPGFSIMTRDGVDITEHASRGPKTKEQREHAALMRKLKACGPCKKSKQRCDPSHHQPSALFRISASASPSSNSTIYSSNSSSGVLRDSTSPQSSFGDSFIQSPTLLSANDSIAHGGQEFSPLPTLKSVLSPSDLILSENLLVDNDMFDLTMQSLDSELFQLADTELDSWDARFTASPPTEVNGEWNTHEDVFALSYSPILVSKAPGLASSSGSDGATARHLHGTAMPPGQQIMDSIGLDNDQRVYSDQSRELGNCLRTSHVFGTLGDSARSHQSLNEVHKRSNHHGYDFILYPESPCFDLGLDGNAVRDIADVKRHRSARRRGLASNLHNHTAFADRRPPIEQPVQSVISPGSSVHENCLRPTVFTKSRTFASSSAHAPIHSQEDKRFNKDHGRGKPLNCVDTSRSYLNSLDNVQASIPVNSEKMLVNHPDAMGSVSTEPSKDGQSLCDYLDNGIIDSLQEQDDVSVSRDDASNRQENVAYPANPFTEYTISSVLSHVIDSQSDDVQMQSQEDVLSHYSIHDRIINGNGDRITEASCGSRVEESPMNEHSRSPPGVPTGLPDIRTFPHVPNVDDNWRRREGASIFVPHVDDGQLAVAYMANLYIKLLEDSKQATTYSKPKDIPRIILCGIPARGAEQESQGDLLGSLSDHSNFLGHGEPHSDTNSLYVHSIHDTSERGWSHLPSRIHPGRRLTYVDPNESARSRRMFTSITICILMTMSLLRSISSFVSNNSSMSPYMGQASLDAMLKFQLGLPAFYSPVLSTPEQGHEDIGGFLFGTAFDEIISESSSERDHYHDLAGAPAEITENVTAYIIQNELREESSVYEAHDRTITSRSTSIISHTSRGATGSPTAKPKAQRTIYRMATPTSVSTLRTAHETTLTVAKNATNSRRELPSFGRRPFSVTNNALSRKIDVNNVMMNLLGLSIKQVYISKRLYDVL